METERNVRRGEVWYVRDGESWGHEQGSGRPAIVLTDTTKTENLEVVNCVLMTTAPKKLWVNVKLSSIPKQSWALCNQIVSVDVRRLTKYICTLNSREMGQVENNVRQVLGLPTLEPEVVEKIVEKEVIVEVPAVVDEIQAQVESELYQKLYMKAMTSLVETRYERDELQLKYDKIKRGEYIVDKPYDIPAVTPKITAEKVVDVVGDEPVNLDVVDLAAKMMSPKTGELVEPVGRDEAVPKALGKSTGGTKAKALTSNEIDEILIQAGMKPRNVGKGEAGRAKLAAGAKITNVNTATKQEFMALGMSETVTGEILKHRKKHGRFVSVADLLSVKKFGRQCMITFGPMLTV